MTKKKSKSSNKPKSSSRTRQKSSKATPKSKSKSKSTATRMPKFPKPEGIKKRKAKVSRDNTKRDNTKRIEAQHNKILSKAKVSAEWDALYNHSAAEKMARGAQQISKITPYARHDNWRVPAKGKNNRHVVKKKK